MEAVVALPADATAGAAEPADISVLLLSWNTRELTLECLDSLPVGIDDDVKTEVIVVDNGSRDGSAEALARRGEVTLIANPENQGYAAAVNQAYERATGEFVLLLNSDVVFRPGALSTLVRFLREHPDVAGVGPLYLNPDGTEQQHHYRFPSFGATIGNMSRLLARIPPFARRVREYRMLDDDFTKPRPVEQPSASCLLIRRSALADERLMDEQFPIYFNDVALAYSLASQGHTLWMTPESVVVHEHGASTRQLGGQLARQHIGAHVRYLKMTEPRYRVEVFRGLVFVQKLALLVLRRPGRLALGDLAGALRGDPGPVPAAPLDAGSER